MKRLLYLAYPFPPGRFVACIRTWNTARQLSRLGWKVTVATPNPDLWRRVANRESFSREAAAAGIDILLTGHDWRWLDTDNIRSRFPRVAWAVGGPARRVLRRIGLETQVGWIPAVRRACASFGAGGFDAILATGCPFSSFSEARRLGERLRCPYVLDYRDLWTTGNPHAVRSHPAWIGRAERRAYGDAAAVVVVSRVWGEMLGDALGRPEKIHVISNGYDAGDLAGVEPTLFREPAVVYAGVFYPPKRVLDPVLAALKALRQREPDRKWMFHYYGACTGVVEAAAVSAGIRERVEIHGEVPRAEVLSASKGAHCSVVITSVVDTESRSDRGLVTGKVFELVGMGAEVLLVAPPHSEAEQAIRGCGRRFSGSQVAEMEAHLAAVVAGPQARHTPPAEFEWSALGSQLDRILDSVVCS